MIILQKDSIFHIFTNNLRHFTKQQMMKVYPATYYNRERSIIVLLSNSEKTSWYNLPARWAIPPKKNGKKFGRSK